MNKNIFTYNFSIEGKAHTKKDIPCQDYFEVIWIDNERVIGITADGVGSCQFADKASKTAVKEAGKFIKENLPHNLYDITLLKAWLIMAFSRALRKINELADSMNESVNEFHTTLDIAIYDGNGVIYMHSGDGGIIAMTEWGEFVLITRQQKGTEQNHVYPLSSTDKWEFGEYRSEKIISVLMVTDGMLEKPICYPNINKLQKYEYYIPVLTFLADPDTFKVENKQTITNSIEEFITAKSNYDSNKFYNILFDTLIKKFPDESENAIYDIINSITKYNMPINLMHMVTDDKTVLGLININAKQQRNPKEYYFDLDWENLNNILYPNQSSTPKQDIIKQNKSTTNNKKIFKGNPIKFFLNLRSEQHFSKNTKVDKIDKSLLDNISKKMIIINKI